ncbi:MAG: tRNA (guanosine(37)-N1)-methyltransferase TrmD [Alicyclobacillus herbarius]|uniref:tRNA (guanosine(37)-N1)-methyltransferase TrmD n=1 Tax=Alicyclobacillus herbarius TaxID=122960 RepID=UPI002357E888|nr:tRNA (guanosine(37)-N1)-methyltransferase TrmD [Alicyclobacillus herbarius]MCL6633372.1 tRNA (guanosine(37)-N1)-methyltransferase TrmD [Alicyclobacillus herbarius]
MLEIYILTLFPDMFRGVLSESILKRAVERGHVRFELINFRDFAPDRHRTVDDYPFGGGVGMVLKPQPIFDAVDDIRTRVGSVTNERVLLMTPAGRPFTQSFAEELADTNGRLIFICGHYEGFDERIAEHLATDEVSLGDFVMTGGEIAAMAMIDAIVRLLPGVLGNEASAKDESFVSGLLEYPQYTRPADFRGLTVPDILLSGHHERIRRWRHRQALWRTWRRRPDLLERVALSADDRALLRAWQNGDFSDLDDES